MHVSAGHYSVVKLLGGVNTIITKDKRFGAPLWWAALALREGEEGGLELAKLLVEQGAVVGAIGKGHDEEEDDAADEDEDDDDDEDNNAVEVVEGADESTPLMLAAQAVSNGVVGGLELATLLVEKGADVDKGNPLWWAVKEAVSEAVSNGQRGGEGDGMELAKLLMEEGADVNQISNGDNGDYSRVGTPLWLAVHAVKEHGAAGGLELAKLLVENGANVNIAGEEYFDDTFKGAPLLFAACAVRNGAVGGLELARLLVESGADVNAVLKSEFTASNMATPLLFAETAVCNGVEGGLELAKLLVDKGADISAPLWYTAIWNQETDGGLELAKHLVRKGANVNVVGTYGPKEDGEEGEDSTPLFLAAMRMFEGRGCRRGGLELARFLIEMGANVNVMGNALGSQCTPLGYAGYMMSRLATLSRTTHDQKVSRVNDVLELAKILIQNGADINVVSHSLSSSTLWFASNVASLGFAGGLELAKLLVEKGAAVNGVGMDPCGDCEGTPLWMATQAVSTGVAGGLELAKLLLANGADADVNTVGFLGVRNTECTPLWMAAKAAYYEHMEVSLELLELTKLLLQNGADVNGVGTFHRSSTRIECTPLVFVLGGRNTCMGRLEKELVKLLVEKGADVNAVCDVSDTNCVGRELFTPLLYACSSGGIPWGLELVELLIKKGAHVNPIASDDGDRMQITPLLLAAEELPSYRGAMELVKLLVEKGADVNAFKGEKNGSARNTPLWYASFAFSTGDKDGLELAKLLVEKGATVNSVYLGACENGYTSTPLYLAALAATKGIAGGLELVKLLAESGADIDLFCCDEVLAYQENTALLLAARAVSRGAVGALELAKFLVDKRADVNAVSRFIGYGVARCCTPLWWAALAVTDCEGGAGLALAKLLVRNGADVNVVGPSVGWEGLDPEEYDAESSTDSTPMWRAVQAVKDGKEHGVALVQLLVSAGGKLADTEKAEWQSVVDDVIGTLVNRRKSRGCFIGVPGTTGTRAAIAGVAARDDEHLQGVSNDLDLAMSHWGSRSVWTQYGAMIDKHLAMKHITRYLNDDADDDPDADTFVLQWSGHGAGPTGDWCVADGGRITFDDIMGVWDNSRAKARNCLLVLVLDSCHSGKWVELAREHNLQDVIIQAACASGEVTFDKFFTELIIRYHKGEVTRDEALTVTRSSRRLKMHPCAYVPWGDVSTPLTCERSNKVFTFLSVQ
jgi:ankyrin repeat protein